MLDTEEQRHTQSYNKHLSDCYLSGTDLGTMDIHGDEQNKSPASATNNSINAQKINGDKRRHVVLGGEVKQAGEEG